MACAAWLFAAVAVTVIGIASDMDPWELAFFVYWCLCAAFPAGR